MSTIAADIAELVTQLNAIEGVKATGDPRSAAGATGVVVLVEPPIRDYTNKEQTWQLTLLKNTTDVGLDTTKAFSVVLALLEASDLPIEEARPSSRRLSIDRPPVPAYLVRLITP